MGKVITRVLPADKTTKNNFKEEVAICVTGDKFSFGSPVNQTRRFYYD